MPRRQGRAAPFGAERPESREDLATSHGLLDWFADVARSQGSLCRRRCRTRKQRHRIEDRPSCRGHATTATSVPHACSPLPRHRSWLATAAASSSSSTCPAWRICERGAVRRRHADLRPRRSVAVRVPGDAGTGAQGGPRHAARWRGRRRASCASRCSSRCAILVPPRRRLVYRNRSASPRPSSLPACLSRRRRAPELDALAETAGVHFRLGSVRVSGHSGTP